MKKLFFFRSSNSCNNGNGNNGSPPSADYWEDMVESGVKHNQGSARSDKSENSFRSPRVSSKSRKQVSDSQTSGADCSGIWRSRSLSSAAFLVDGLGQRDLSPSGSSSGAHLKQCNRSSRTRAATPEKLPRMKRSEMAATQVSHGERPASSGSSKSLHGSSGNSSSSNVSSKVLDRYIDGEQQQQQQQQQQQERIKSKSSSSQMNFAANGNASGRFPPRVQYVAPTSPADVVKDKPKFHSFRETKGSRLGFSSRDWVENGFGHESPRRLAKNVIERLSQTHSYSRPNSNDFDPDMPITVEDVYGGSHNSRCFSPNFDVPAPKSYSLEEPYETYDSYHGDDPCGFQEQYCSFGDSFGDANSIHIEDSEDVELQRKSKEAEDRVVFLSDELEQETFLQDIGFDMPSLIQTIRKLTEDKISLAIEVSGLLKSRIADRDYSKEELRLARAEWESRTHRLEKEKNELQSALEKELDRRSSDWSSKLEKYQLEEQRLRERVRELAEQNVSLQREVSSFNEKETESKSVITYSEQQLRQLSSRLEEVTQENQDLRLNLSEFQEKYSVAKEDLDCIKRNFEEKDMECKELQKSITRLLRTCSEQEKTIVGLREGLGEVIDKKQSLDKLDKLDKLVEKLQMEQMRLTGVELTLRREVESQRIELDSLRHENINLLNRLKANGRETDAFTFKLDREMWTRISYLQSQGLSMLNDSTQLSSKLLDYIKVKASQLSEGKQGVEPMRNGLDGHFLVESDVKVQGFKRGTESLTRSLQTISSLLQEKSNLVSLKSQSSCSPAGTAGKLNHRTSDESARFELKAETLLTSLLREKLHAKELEVEQLQGELAAAVRGNDILRSEVQNALDNISCANHNLKDLELQLQRKDENINRLQSDLQESKRELTIMKGILPKVSEERDLMWEEVKQYNEKNMLLNSEVNMLKKKIEALDEDILLKEGQITILKDTIGSKPFDLLASSDSTRDFLLE